MAAEAVLKELKSLRIPLTIHRDRLRCRAPGSRIPAKLKKGLAENRDELLEIVRQNEEEEKLKSPYGPLRRGLIKQAKKHPTLSRIEVEHQESCRRDVCTCQPDITIFQMEENWDFREIQIDGTTDTWMVGTRLDKPREFKFWATNHPSSCDDNPQEKIEDGDL